MFQRGKDPSDTDLARQPLFEMALKTRHTLTLVSHLWYTISIENLYTSVLLHSLRQHDAFVASITSKEHLGTRVKRLIIHQDACLHQILPIILKLCPNAKIIDAAAALAQHHNHLPRNLNALSLHMHTKKLGPLLDGGSD